MKYKFENQVIKIEDPNYGALGDDFSFMDLEALDIILNKIENVLSERSEKESIYGNMCYRIDISKEKSMIFCYGEYLGEEDSLEIYNMLKDYREIVKSTQW